MDGRTKEERQRVYASEISTRNIKNLGLGPDPAVKDAAEAIRKIANKSKNDRDLEKLAKLLKERVGEDEKKESSEEKK